MEIKTVDDARMALGTIHIMLQNHDTILNEAVKTRTTIEMAKSTEANAGSGQKFDEDKAKNILKGTEDDAKAFGARICEITNTGSLTELRDQARTVAQMVDVLDTMIDRLASNSFLLSIYTNTNTVPVLPDGVEFDVEQETREVEELKRQIAEGERLLIEAAKPIAPADITSIITLNKGIVTAN